MVKVRVEATRVVRKELGPMLKALEKRVKQRLRGANLLEDKEALGRALLETAREVFGNIMHGRPEFTRVLNQVDGDKVPALVVPLSEEREVEEDGVKWRTRVAYLVVPVVLLKKTLGLFTRVGEVQLYVGKYEYMEGIIVRTDNGAESVNVRVLLAVKVTPLDGEGITVWSGTVRRIRI